MNVKIVCVGSIKEKFYCDAVNEYVKRLSRFVNLKIIELKEEKLPKNASNAQIENAVKLESLKIMQNLEGYVVLCNIKGKSFTSTEFAKQLKKLENDFSTITFVIGGSCGVSDELVEKANLNLSFSAFTFPHQMFRVILLEQIYRAYTIINNITYHK